MNNPPKHNRPDEKEQPPGKKDKNQNAIGIYVVAGLCALAQFVVVSNSARADVALDFGGSAFRIDNNTTFGWSFTLSSAVFVTNLGYFDFTADGLDDAHPVAIWSGAGGTPLAFATVPAGTGAALLNNFRYVAIAPVFLPPGTYTIGGYSPAFTDSVGVVAGTITTAPGITFTGSRSAQGVGLMFPSGNTQGFPNGCFGPNFQFVPEPSTTALALVGAAGGFLWRQKRKARKRCVIPASLRLPQ
jgi:hypothetical protein